MAESHEHEHAGDASRDEVIGRAFRWSALGILLIATVAGAIAYFVTREPEKLPIDEGPVQPALEQKTERVPPVVRFTDITSQSGIDFVHTNGATGRKFLPETMGPGVAVIDYDSDGDPDLLFLNGHAWDGDSSDRPTVELYANDGRAGFEKVTEKAGLAISLYAMGAAVGDYDGDGDSDVFITTIFRNRLFRNDGARFVEVTDEAGVAGGSDTWSTSAGFFDGDNDGDLDLFVCNYLRWSREIDDKLDYRLTGVGRGYGPPTDYEGTQAYYYRNEGNGTFQEVAEESGLHVLNPGGTAAGKALGLLPLDVDRDGQIDIFVANDTVANFLFLGKGGGTFDEMGRDGGVAFDNNGAATGAMGVDGAYFLGDLTLGIGVGNFATETSSLYVSEGGDAFFTDEALAEGVGAVSRQMLSFGFFFLDYDLDGFLDIFQTNGHLEEEINKVQPSQFYEQPSQLFWNSGPETRSCFVPVGDESVGDLAKPIVGRGAAYADLDGDGDLDIVVTQTARPPLLLRNDQTLGHHWLRVKLRGDRGNRDAIGAWVEVRAGGKTQRQQVMPTRSYLSQVETTLTFGLGTIDKVDSLGIRWPRSDAYRDYGEHSTNRTLTFESPGE